MIKDLNKRAVIHKAYYSSCLRLWYGWSMRGSVPERAVWKGSTRFVGYCWSQLASSEYSPWSILKFIFSFVAWNIFAVNSLDIVQSLIGFKNEEQSARSRSSQCECHLERVERGNIKKGCRRKSHVYRAFRISVQSLNLACFSSSSRMQNLCTWNPLSWNVIQFWKGGLNKGELFVFADD